MATSNYMDSKGGKKQNHHKPNIKKNHPEIKSTWEKT